MNQRERKQATAPQAASIKRDQASLVRQTNQLAPLMAAPGAATMAGQAAALAQASGGDLRRAAPALRQLQQHGGNAYVQRVVDLARAAGPPANVAPDIEQGIQHARGGGQPLHTDLRRQMERGFGVDFGGVRVHTSPAADALNRAIQARAFTTGSDIFFRQGEYDPAGPAGRELLAHELAHVVQQTGGIHPKLVVGAVDDVYEREADAAAREVLRGQIAPVAMADAAPTIRRRRDPSLPQRLKNIEAAVQNPAALPIESALRVVYSELHDIDLADRDNVREITELLARKFPPDVLFQFLEHREQEARQDRLRTPGRRGAYGTFTPFAMLELSAGIDVEATAEGAMEKLSAAFENAGAFLEGLYGGLKAATTPEQFNHLLRRLSQSMVLTSVFPPVFLAGAAVGMVEELIDTIKTLANLDELLDAADQILEVLFDPAGAEVAQAMGQAMGEGLAQQIHDEAKKDPFRFTYNLGRIIGPTVVGAIASIVLPGVGVGALATRLGNLLRRFLKLFPRLERLIKRVGSIVRPASKIIDEVMEIEATSTPVNFELSRSSRAIELPDTELEELFELESHRYTPVGDVPTEPLEDIERFERLSGETKVRRITGLDTGRHHTGRAKVTPLKKLQPTAHAPTREIQARSTEAERIYGVYFRSIFETPSPGLRAWAQRKLRIGSRDPAFPTLTVTKPAHADHIVPAAFIRRMEGFAELDVEAQAAILNMKENFEALSEIANTSKGSRLPSEWTGHKGLNLPVDETFLQRMIEKEKKLIPHIQQRINKLLGKQRRRKWRQRLTG